jgi:hypothetical protein
MLEVSRTMVEDKEETKEDERREKEEERKKENGEVIVEMVICEPNVHFISFHKHSDVPRGLLMH